MKSHRARLTPQMEHYTFVLEDQPYLEFFQYGNEHSPVLATDPHGFRVTVGPDGAMASVAGPRPAGPARLFAGSSAAFGVGASSNRATIPSRLWSQYAPETPWLNFAGQAHNSTQELLVLTLFQHMLPPLEQIILFSGINNLVLSRFPEEKQGRHGAFFECDPGLDLKGVRPSPSERIARAAELTTRHIGTWKLLASALGAPLTYVLQPLAPWVREKPSKNEALLFAELDRASNFRWHNDIATIEIGQHYAEALHRQCKELGVTFVDTNRLLAGGVDRNDWLFVDRVHCNDAGYDLLAKLLANHLNLT